MLMELYVKPLSVNEVWQGRRYKTTKYKQYERDVLNLIKARCIASSTREEFQMVRGQVSIILSFYVKNWKMCDVDNFVKPLLDIIVKAGLIEDDRLVMRLAMVKRPVANPAEQRVQIIISKYIDDYEV